MRIAEHAAAAGSYLWIDMEGSAYVEATIALYERLRATQPKTGICLQAYLRRTAADIERLRPLDPAIRLVKGAYDEKAAIAYRDRRSVDANFVGLAVRFLLDGRGRPIRLGLGTHDVALIEQIAEQVGAAGIGRDGVRGRDAVRHPDRPAVPPGEARAIASRPSSPTVSTGIRGTCGGSPSAPRTCWFVLRQMLP